MALQVVMSNEKKPSGVFIPLEDWAKLNDTVRPSSPIYDLMEELTLSPEIRKFKEEYILPSGSSVREVERSSGGRIEAIYMDAFANGLPRYYKDDRCMDLQNLIRAMPDGSEDLINFDWKTREEALVRHLLPAGQGKFAYLLNDPRFQNKSKD